MELQVLTMWLGTRRPAVFFAMEEISWGQQLVTFRAPEAWLALRPSPTPNAEAMFLDRAWKRLEEALQAKDAAKARRAFLVERDACMPCHVAEQMPFLNDMHPGYGRLSMIKARSNCFAPHLITHAGECSYDRARG